MNYNLYENILEYVPKNSMYESTLKDEVLYNELYKFLYINKENKVLISLSGGVDSMVLLEIMCKIKEVDSIEIICCHINYNNRVESIIERNFLKDYCREKNVIFECMDFDFKRGSIKRNAYEEQTRKLRYQYYKELIEKYDTCGVFLGHHEDDVCENIYNNIMRGGREITDLLVLKKEKSILDVNVYRPLLDFRKNIIYEFSHKYQVPYFLDTTPEWSCRGKMRNNIFPSCDDCYGENYKNSLLQLGNQGEELGHIIEKHIMNDLYKKVIFDNMNFKFELSDVLKEKYILRNLLHKICVQLQIGTIKQKNIDILLCHINIHAKHKICILKNYSTYCSNNILYFMYHK